MDFKIDDEIRSLLTPLTKEEFNQLEKNILGPPIHVDDLVLFKLGSDLILGDGYNRLSICKTHGIPFEMRVLKMPSREAAIQWVIDNQLGRRNLTDERRAYYRGKEYLNNRKNIGNPQFPHNEGIAKPTGESAEKIAEKHGVSRATVERDAEFAEAVDALPPNAKEAVLSGDSGETKKSITEGAKPMFCPRCTRVGPVKDCPQCHELRNSKPKEPRKPKDGREVFDDTPFNELYGKLVRFLDARATAHGKGVHHDRCLSHMSALIANYKLWKQDKP